MSFGVSSYPSDLNAFCTAVPILSKLKSRTSLITKDGKHIGLTNTYERLDSLYQQDYYIHFMNKPEGGAMIKLILPNQNKKGATNENLTR